MKVHQVLKQINFLDPATKDVADWKHEENLSSTVILVSLAQSPAAGDASKLRMLEDFYQNTLIKKNSDTDRTLTAIELKQIFEIDPNLGTFAILKAAYDKDQQRRRPAPITVEHSLEETVIHSSDPRHNAAPARASS